MQQIGKICLELAFFEEFVTALLQTITKRCLSSLDHLFESVTTSACNGVKKRAISTDI